MAFMVPFDRQFQANNSTEESQIGNTCGDVHALAFQRLLPTFLVLASAYLLSSVQHSDHQWHCQLRHDLLRTFWDSSDLSPMRSRRS